jgi:hypothetical protein
MEKIIMTRKEFRSLGKRDFENGAIKNKIADRLFLLEELVGKIDSFESQREGNAQPVLLEFSWNEVLETYNKAK